MKPYFWIAKKRFKPVGQPQEFRKVDELDIDKFRSIVDEDAELIWFENTEHGKREIEICLSENIEFAYEKKAHFDIDQKYGSGKVIFSFGRYQIPIQHKTTTKKNVKKIKEVADKMEVKMFKNRTELTSTKFKELLSNLKK